MQVSKKEIIKALVDLEQIQKEYHIQDLRLVDNPVTCGIISDMTEIPKKYRKFIYIENVPAICVAGVKPNVIEDPIITT